jgi:hypothetical protein
LCKFSRNRGTLIIFFLIASLPKLILIEIKIYGIIEVITGTIKLLLLAVIICVLIAINRGGELWLRPLQHQAFKYLKCSAFNIRFKKWVFIVTLQLVLNVSFRLPSYYNP